MSKRFTGGIFLLATILLCNACGIQDTYSGDTQRSEIMTAWYTMATSQRSIADIAQEAAPLAEKAAQQGEAGLLPFLDIMADPDEAPETKVLALIALTPHISKFPTLSNRVTEITAEGNETTSRACATDLLGFFDLPETNARLRQLLSDSESRVSIAALIVLMKQEDPQAIARIKEMFHAKDTNVAQQGDIAMMMPTSATRQHLDLFAEVLLNKEMPYQARLRAVAALGNAQDDSVLQTLKQSALNDADDSIRAMATAAVAAVEESLQLQ